MDNQHRKIIGYRELTEAEVELMNRIKAHAAVTEALGKDVQAHISKQFVATQPKYGEADEFDPMGEKVIDTPEESAAKVNEGARLNQAQPGRWLSISQTHFQEGFMALVRAVAQPTTL